MALLILVLIACVAIVVFDLLVAGLVLAPWLVVMILGLLLWALLKVPLPKSWARAQSPISQGAPDTPIDVPVETMPVEDVLVTAPTDSVAGDMPEVPETQHPRVEQGFNLIYRGAKYHPHLEDQKLSPSSDRITRLSKYRGHPCAPKTDRSSEGLANT